MFEPFEQSKIGLISDVSDYFTRLRRQFVNMIYNVDRFVSSPSPTYLRGRRSTLAGVLVHITWSQKKVFN